MEKAVERWAGCRWDSREWRRESSLGREDEVVDMEDMEVEDVKPESREENGSDEQDEEEESMTSMGGKEAVLKGRVGTAGGEGCARGANEAEDEKEW